MEHIQIKFQEGPIGEVGVNGTQIEDVIEVLVKRLQNFQSGKLPCRENALAITHLETAQLWLEHRTSNRRKQSVEGTNMAHKS
jgi:hypothetical protein